jgi:hypothetical protein
MSDKPIAERLQVKGERRLAVVDAPSNVDKAVGAVKARGPVKSADVVLLFVRSQAELKKELPMTLKIMGPAAIFWLAYPKLTSPLAGDLSRDIIRDAAPVYGLDTVSQIAIDEDWSALRLKRT